MSGLAPAAGEHAALMDSIYRGQRHIYDLTRKYYLFGRDTLIDGLDCAPGHSVLEVGCGTGRNLAKVARRCPGATLHGLDISNEMLKSAGARLGPDACLARGDATALDAAALFGTRGFDRVVLSYALSMIPDWEAALAQAIAALNPGGSLHVVDFGNCAGLPAPVRAGLNAWLARFHVSPRLDLPERAAALGAERDCRTHAERGPLGYYDLVRVARAAD